MFYPFLSKLTELTRPWVCPVLAAVQRSCGNEPPIPIICVSRQSLLYFPSFGVVVLKYNRFLTRLGHLPIIFLSQHIIFNWIKIWLVWQWMVQDKRKSDKIFFISLPEYTNISGTSIWPSLSIFTRHVSDFKKVFFWPEQIIIIICGHYNSVSQPLDEQFLCRKIIQHGTNSRTSLFYSTHSYREFGWRIASDSECSIIISLPSIINQPHST